MRRLVGAGVTAACLALSSLLVAAPASAHAEVEGSTPRNGSVVRTAPSEVSVRFGEDVGFKSVRLLAPSGTAITSTAHVHGATLTITPTGVIPDGPVTAAWTIVSDDGDLVSGAIAFVVGTAPPTGLRQTLTSFPRLPTRLSGSRPGVLTLTIATKGIGGEVEWTSAAVPEPITWKLAPDSKTVVGRGVLSLSGTWSYTATIAKKGGAVVVVKGAATLGAGTG